MDQRICVAAALFRGCQLCVPVSAVIGFEIQPELPRSFLVSPSMVLRLSDAAASA